MVRTASGEKTACFCEDDVLYFAHIVQFESHIFSFKLCKTQKSETTLEVDTTTVIDFAKDEHQYKQEINVSKSWKIENEFFFVRNGRNFR